MCFEGVCCFVLFWFLFFYFYFLKFYDVLHKGENCICIFMSILCSLLIYTPTFYLPILLVLIMTIISFKKRKRKKIIIKLSFILKVKSFT
jgi:hypothetical protein